MNAATPHRRRRRPTAARPVLLVTFAGTRWWPAPPRKPGQPIAIVADLIEESLQPLELPALSGRDRSTYLRTQAQAQTGAQGWYAHWAESPGLLPRPSRATRLSLNSATLAQALDEQLRAQRPIIGLWSVTALLLRALPRPADPSAHQLTALPTEHGCRLLLTRGRQPLFTRLLPVVAAVELEQELIATVRYLRDNAMVPREQPLALWWWSPQPPAFAPDALGPNIRLLHEPAVTPWPDLLTRARLGAPLQLATDVQRRYFLAWGARQALHGLGIVALAGLAWATLGAWQMLDSQRLSNESLARRLVDAQQKLDAIRQTLQAEQVDIGVLKQALQIPHLKPEAPAMPPLADTAWLTAQWQQRLPAQALLAEWRWQRDARCDANPSGTEAGAAPTSPAGEGAPTAPPLRLELAFDLSPAPSVAARERWVSQADTLLGAQAGWTVARSPIMARAQQALRVGGVATAKGEGDRAEWCLHRAPPPAPDPAAPAPPS
jgi:hypothetical protein